VQKNVSRRGKASTRGKKTYSFRHKSTLPVTGKGKNRREHAGSDPTSPEQRGEKYLDGFDDGRLPFRRKRKIQNCRDSFETEEKKQ